MSTGAAAGGSPAQPVKLCKANLAKISAASPSVDIPTYDRSKITAGVVHIGVGNFHRAHQSVFMDDVLRLPDHENWGLVGMGLMPSDSKMQTVLREQDMMYTLWEKGVSSSKVRVMSCHSDFILAPSSQEEAVRVLSAKETKIVTLTVTEKGYFVNVGTGHLDTSAPPVAQDIKVLSSRATGKLDLKTAAGYLVAAARRRMSEGSPGFVVLSCDNVQENGRKASMAVLEMAENVDAALAAWIRKEVSFPNSMVDRITPATTDEAKAALVSEYGISDGWPVVCESFLLWVVEDKFPHGRPKWEMSPSGTCIFVEDVVPYELMKLRLLNAVHQALGFPAILLGYELVHEAMADHRVVSFLEKYMAAAKRTVPPVAGLDRDEWCKTVIERFSNPAIRDTIFRLNEDATNRIAIAVAPCLEPDAVAPGQGLSSEEIHAIMLPITCWIRCMLSDTLGPLPGDAKLNHDDRGDTMRVLAGKLWEAAGDNLDSLEREVTEPGEAASFLREAFGAQAATPLACSVLVSQVQCLQTHGIEALLAAHIGEPVRYTVSPELYERVLRGEQVSLREITGEAITGEAVGNGKATKKKVAKVSKKKRMFGCC